MMNDLVKFDFEENVIRVITIANEPWFVVKDICKILEIGNVTVALDRLEGDEFSATKVIDSVGREQVTKILNESGLYSLILGSRKPEAKRFKKWVTSEVLPAIRKTGQYSLQKETLLPSEILLQSVQLLVDLERKQNDIELRVKAIEERPVINAQIEHFSIMGYCHNIGKQVSLKHSISLSYKCKDLCRELGLPTGKISDSRFGSVNTYPLDVLRKIIGGPKL